jgi:pilus assembly protein CpaC
VRSYSEGVPGIVDIRLTRDGKQFVIVGKRSGTTSLLLMLAAGGELAYSIVVSEPSATAGAGPGEAAPDRVEPRDNVRLDFYFVQLGHDYRHQLGLWWPPAVGGPRVRASFDLRAGALTDATAVITDQALPSLDIAQAQGWAKLLRRAAVVTQNGSEATFGGGGEVNIPVQSSLSVGVRQIAFGSKIRVRPRYDRDSGRIELAIDADVSDLSSDHGSGIPGRTTSVLSSTVNLELGQSIVLAGLTARSESGDKKGLPGLSQIPILGALFGTHGHRSEHTENLVFIVPSVIDAVASDARARVERALRAYHEFDGDLDDSELPALRDHTTRPTGAAPKPPEAQP